MSRVGGGGQGVLTPPLDPPLSSVTSLSHPTRSHSRPSVLITCCNLLRYVFVFYPWAWLGNFNLNVPLESEYARFVVLGRLMYWTPPPPDQSIGPPLLKSDDLIFSEPRDIVPTWFYLVSQSSCRQSLFDFCCLIYYLKYLLDILGLSSNLYISKLTILFHNLLFVVRMHHNLILI